MQQNILKQNRPKVGIITANYNGGKYFKEYLDGLRSQTVKPDYIVYVDDCSNDNFQPALKFNCMAYEDGHMESTLTGGIKFIFIQRKINGGPGAARNDALRFLHGKVEIIGVNDSDDVFYPTKIEKSIIPFIKYPNVGLVYSDYDVLNEKTGEKKREYKEIFNQIRLNQECIVSNAGFFRLNVAEQVGLYDEDRDIISLEDYSLWMKQSAISSIYHIPESLYMYRIHGDNLTVATPTSVLNQRHGKMRQNLAQWMESRKNG